MNKVLMSMGAAILVAFSINTHAEMMYNVDTRVGMAYLENSGDQTELNSVASFIPGIDPNDLVLVEKNEAPTAMMVNDMGVEKWVIELTPPDDAPGYFALKFGIGSTGIAYNTYIFENVMDFSRLVFTDGLVDGLMSNCMSGSYDCRLSHYTSVNAVPLPAAFWLFGSALIGLLALARRRNQHASYA